MELLYEEHAPALFAFLLNLTRDEADTRDALQTVFIRLGRDPDLLTGVRSPRHYLLRLAHNAAVDLIRRRDARQRHENRFGAERIELFATAADPDERAFQSALADALGVLPEDQRAVVHLKLWEGLTFDAIAAALEIPQNTAASRYRYAIDKLRARLRPLYNEIKDL